MTDTVAISLDLPASHRFLNVLSACIDEMLKRVDDERIPSEATIYGLQLAAQEIGTNIVRHAYVGPDKGRIAVQLSYDAATREFALVFKDTGQEYREYAGAPSDPDAIPDAAEDGGMGLYLIAALVDDLNYQWVNGENIWQIVKRLE